MKISLYKINDSYLLKQENWQGLTIEIDGKRILDFHEGWIKEHPTKVLIISNETKTVGYGNLSVKEYNDKVTDLLKGVKYGYQDQYPQFANLDEEFAYRKFIAEHPQQTEIYEVSESAEIIEYDISGKRDNEYIIPYRFLGGILDNKEIIMYRYAPNPYKMAQGITTSLDLTEVEATTWGTENTIGRHWSVPNHSREDLDFLKVDGKYADRPDSKYKFYAIISGTYKECEDRYNEHMAHIRRIFEHEIKKMNAVGATFDKAMMMKGLRGLHSMVEKMEVKANSPIKPSHVNHQINTMIQNI